MSYLRFTTLEELQETASKRSESFSDVKVSSKAIRFKHEQLRYGMTPLFNSAYISAEMEDWPYQQVAGRLDAPPWSWLSNPQRAPWELRDLNMNWLAENRPDKGLLIRLDGDKVRAIMSEQYTPFDTHTFLPMVIDAVKATGWNHILGRTWYDRDHLSAYLLFPDIKVDQDPRSDNGKGQLHPAAFISNNEVGRGGVRVLPAVFTGVCLNGVIFGLRSKANTFEGGFIRHRWIDVELIKRQVANAIAGALEMSEERTKKYVQSYEIPIEEGSLKALVSKWGDKYNLSNEQQSTWESTAIQEARTRGQNEDLTWGDLINGVTRMSHYVGDATVANQYDGIGGDLIQELFRLPEYEEVILTAE